MNRQAVADPQAASAAAGPYRLLQRQCDCGTHTPGGGECKTCSRQRLQRWALAGEADRGLAAGTGKSRAEVPPVVHAVLAGPGRPLDAPTRSLFEARFGQDFSGVRIHTDGAAATSARAVGALAYTVGRQIVFGNGQYAPATKAGQRLLAHELVHTVQQQRFGAALNAQLEVGPADSAAETEAERAADRAVRGLAPPVLHVMSSAAMQRQADPAEVQAEPDFNSPQQRGGRARAAFVDAGRRGDDTVRIAVTRYLCDCVGRNVTKASVKTRVQPGPGVTVEICRGSVTARLTGDVVPSSATTGRASVGVDVNVAGRGGTGVRTRVQGEARNTGSEPQLGGSADVRVQTPGGPSVGAKGEILRGSRSGRIDTSVGAGVEVDVPGLGKTRIGVEGTNLQDQRRGGQITLGGNLPGQQVEDKTCRECRCPVVYECVEDVPPRDVERTVTFDVETRGRLRYYFGLDTDRDTRDPVLRGESTRVLDEVARRVAAGARVAAITGYASPEDNRERPSPNQQLSLSRGKRLHDLLAARLGSAVPLPEASGGGELLGRVPTIAPGSKLAGALLETGFGDAEDVTQFLIGPDIANPKLAEQFLALLERLPEPADRLRLFGVDPGSPAAAPLQAAIATFVRSRGRGPRPWESVFAFLRYASVELSTTGKAQRKEAGRTSGSLTPMNDTQCRPYARQAEVAGQFGPASREPSTEAECPAGEARNPARFENKCDYR